MPHPIIQVARVFDQAIERYCLEYDRHAIAMRDIDAELSALVPAAARCHYPKAAAAQFDKRNLYAERRDALWEIYEEMLLEHGPVPTFSIRDFDDADPIRKQESDQIYRRHTRRHDNAIDLSDLSDELVATLRLERLAGRLIKELTPQEAHQRAFAEIAVRVARKMESLVDWKTKQFESRGGRLVGSTRVPSASFDAWKLSWAAGNEIATACDDMRLLAEEAGCDGMLNASTISRLGNELNGAPYRSRMKVEIGAGLQLVFFKDHLEYHFSPVLLEALNLGASKFLELEGKA